MAIPRSVSIELDARGFIFELTNHHTKIAAYCKKIRNLQYKGNRYYNCCILLETEYSNFMTFRILGFHESDDSLRDLTMELTDAVNQIIDIGNPVLTLKYLQVSAFAMRSKYAL